MLADALDQVIQQIQRIQAELERWMRSYQPPELFDEFSSPGAVQVQDTLVLGNFLSDVMRLHGQAVIRLQRRCAGGLYTPVDASPG